MEIITRKEAKEKGLRRYYTGEPCRRGHLTERRIDGACIECARKTKLSDELAEARRVHGDKVITRKEAIDAGLTRYFIGRECKNGHVYERYVSTNQCVLCMREYHVNQTRQGKPPTRLNSSESTALFVPENLRSQVVTKKQAIKQGLKRYFTGLPCKDGHLSERKISSGDCIACVREKHSQNMQDPEYREAKRLQSERGRRSPAGKRYAEKQRFHKALLRRVAHEINLVKDSQLYWHEDPAEVLAKREKKRLLAEARRNAVTQATPWWVDTKQIEAIEQKRKKITSRTSIKHHVDHYYPIQGDTVSGLNVPWNLQVITAHENHIKSNKMPEEFYGLGHKPPTHSPHTHTQS